jgi:hypothetical protein
VADKRKRCLAVVQLAGASTTERLREDVPKIVALLTRFSHGKQELAFRSHDGLLFGYFLIATNPQFLQAEFEKCEGARNGDSFMAFEAGEPVAGVGFTRAWTWLQRHKAD